MSQADIFYKIKIIIVLHLFAGLLCSCSNGSSGSPVPTNLNNLFQPNPQLNGYFQTSDGGSITITKITNISVPKSSTILAIKGDTNSTALYFYFSNTLVGGSISRTIAKFDLATTQWTQTCAFQDNGSFGSGFELDSTYFYILNRKQNSYSDNIRRFSRTTCGEIGAINIPQDIQNDFFVPALSKDTDGQFSWITSGGDFMFNSSSGVIYNWNPIATVGAETFVLNSSTQTRSGVTWTLSKSSDYRSTVIWKFNQTSNSCAWAKIYSPGQNYPDLTWYGYTSRPLIIPGLGNKVYVTNLSDGYGNSLSSVNLYEFDVSGF